MKAILLEFMQKSYGRLALLLVSALMVILLGLLLPQTSITPVIGSITALIIAFVAYPWQKALDRRSELVKELRQVYIRFLQDMDDYEALIDEYHDVVAEGGQTSHLHDKLGAMRDKLYL